LRCVREELAGAVVATVFASADADWDNGEAALHGATWLKRRGNRATDRIGFRPTSS
jgi:hypothetical protein